MRRGDRSTVFSGVLFALILILATGPVSAKVVTYGTNGTTGTIQDVIENASNGDSIFLAGGTYAENIVIDRSLVFGALDSANPPRIITGGSGAGLTLSADGITVNGVSILGNASTGLLVLSDNNRISGITVSGHATGIALKSASDNVLSGNTITENGVGIDVDRSSRSNRIFLNTLNNTVDAVSQSGENFWSSTGQEYQYRGGNFTGPLGNFWQVAGITDASGDGVGASPYTISPSRQQDQNAVVITDTAPLAAPPSAYTVTKSAPDTNLTGGTGQFPPGGLPSSLQQGGVQPTLTLGISGQSPLAGGLPSGQGPQGQPPNPLIGFLIGFWYLIPVAIVISAACGIWYERSRRKKHGPAPAPDPARDSRNATIVQSPAGPAATARPGHEYGARLPAALERKYPHAEYIAEGGVSRVFRVRDEKNNRDAAVKIPIRFDEVTGTQFTKELAIWEGLHHANIVELYAANIFPMPFIEMEYVASSLAEMHFPLPEEKAVSILIGVAEGLRYAHERGIVHRDIKPGNILIAPDGTPKITDWGLSKAEGTKQSGIIGFSLEYAAPEQLAPTLYGEPGPWTDIYQLGVLFYEMLAGRVPFTGDGMGEISHAILHEEPVPAVNAGRHADAINAIIGKCLKKRPQDRYPSVADLIADLIRLGFSG
ncbi:protein kinase domain-containing protein [Methanoregula sp.]|uniref:protein kinase domain-containing protein n=1 Tax=Methanoregula sp. TaxID=2052170 RepID=UPI002BFFDA86|nr:protein kinase [Methanoregula sp.]HVP96860.1 protein kinase [Methanoregula sp.]